MWVCGGGGRGWAAFHPHLALNLSTPLGITTPPLHAMQTLLSRTSIIEHKFLQCRASKMWKSPGLSLFHDAWLIFTYMSKCIIVFKNITWGVECIRGCDEHVDYDKCVPRGCACVRVCVCDHYICACVFSEVCNHATIVPRQAYILQQLTIRTHTRTHTHTHTHTHTPTKWT